MTMTTQETAYVEPLDATQRCDRCPAHAVAVVTLPSGFDLTLCRHHWNENRTALLDGGATVDLHPLPGE